MGDSPSIAVALVDWDNVVDTRIHSENDAASAVREAEELVRGHVLARFPSIAEIQVRLYGSWQFKNGTTTPVARHVNAAIDDLRSYRRPGDALTHTVRSLAVEERYDHGPRLTPYLQESQCRCPEHTPINEQKLADTMIVCDATFYAAFIDYSVFVFSDDIDMAPGLLAAADIRNLISGVPTRDVVWVRPGRWSPHVERRFSPYFSVVQLG